MLRHLEVCLTYHSLQDLLYNHLTDFHEQQKFENF